MIIKSKPKTQIDIQKLKSMKNPVDDFDETLMKKMADRFAEDIDNEIIKEMSIGYLISESSEMESSDIYRLLAKGKSFPELKIDRLTIDLNQLIFNMFKYIFNNIKYVVLIWGCRLKMSFNISDKYEVCVTKFLNINDRATVIDIYSRGIFEKTIRYSIIYINDRREVLTEVMEDHTGDINANFPEIINFKLDNIKDIEYALDVIYDSVLNIYTDEFIDKEITFNIIDTIYEHKQF